MFPHYLTQRGYGRVLALNVMLRQGFLLNTVKRLRLNSHHHVNGNLVNVTHLRMRIRIGTVNFKHKRRFWVMKTTFSRLPTLTDDAIIVAYKDNNDFYLRNKIFNCKDFDGNIEYYYDFDTAADEWHRRTDGRRDLDGLKVRKGCLGGRDDWDEIIKYYPP